MAHKKSLLTKYLSGNESNSDCRSPRHDGRAWFIPETSLSAPSDPESRNAIPVNPGTCSNGHQNLNQVDTNVPKPSHRKEETTTSDGDNFPEDKEFSSKEENHSVERNQSTPSSGENFPEDNSISTQKKSTSDGTIPYLGTQAHPIEPSSSPSDGKISTEVITGGTTDIINVTDSSSTATEEEFTLVQVTSTPLKKKAPALTYSAIRNVTGDSLTMPSSIFGSPETPSQNAQGDGGFSSSDISESELDNILDQNLQSIRSHLESSQKVNRTQKTKFFDEMLKGKKYLQYLQIYSNKCPMKNGNGFICTHNPVLHDHAFLISLSVIHQWFYFHCRLSLD